MDFIQKNWKTILVGVLGLAIGAYLNYVVNKRTNEELLQALKEELDQLQLKANVSRVSSDEQNRIQSLQAQIFLLENKLK